MDREGDGGLLMAPHPRVEEEAIVRAGLLRHQAILQHALCIACRQRAVPIARNGGERPTGVQSTNSR